MKKEKKFKGMKVWGIANEETGRILSAAYDSIERATRSLDSEWTIVVELTVTKVYTREKELKELEVEQIKGE